MGNNVNRPIVSQVKQELRKSPGMRLDGSRDTEVRPIDHAVVAFETVRQRLHPNSLTTKSVDHDDQFIACVWGVHASPL